VSCVTCPPQAWPATNSAPGAVEGVVASRPRVRPPAERHVDVSHPLVSLDWVLDYRSTGRPASDRFFSPRRSLELGSANSRAPHPFAVRRFRLPPHPFAAGPTDRAPTVLRLAWAHLPRPTRCGLSPTTRPASRDRLCLQPPGPPSGILPYPLRRLQRRPRGRHTRAEAAPNTAGSAPDPGRALPAGSTAAILRSLK